MDCYDIVGVLLWKISVLCALKIQSRLADEHTPSFWSTHECILWDTRSALDIYLTAHSSPFFLYCVKFCFCGKGCYHERLIFMYIDADVCKMIRILPVFNLLGMHPTPLHRKPHPQSDTHPTKRKTVKRHITGALWGEFTSDRWIPLIKDQ